MAKKPLPPEQELAAYWRKKANIKESDFDTLEPIPLTDGYERELHQRNL
jgi:hypothetical protein